MSNEIEKSLNILREKYISKLEKIDISKCKVREEKVLVQMPLRVNLSAGWNDTPPYCDEMEGAILNAAIKINGKYPLKVMIEKNFENKIIIINKDTNEKVKIESFEELKDCFEPEKEFCLQKASILGTGMIDINDANSLNHLIKKIGGFSIITETENIPLGSGLGTSSILIAGIIKAIYSYIEIEITNEEISLRTAITEQIMTTGGGYQDQIGALVSGIKLIKFTPNSLEKIKCEEIELSDKMKKELNDRYMIVYCGKSRIAKNLLREVMGKYIKREKVTLDTLKKIGEVAEEMSKNLKENKIEEFGKNMTKCFKLNKQIYDDFSNSEIDNIFKKIENYIDGKMICGAGNGGYIEFILKKGVDKKEIRNIIKKECNINRIDDNEFLF